MVRRLINRVLDIFITGITSPFIWFYDEVRHIVTGEKKKYL